MENTINNAKIYAKLSSITEGLFVPKGQHNDFGKYNYRSCEDILKAVKPICKENGCVLYITNDLEEIGGRNYVRAEAHLVDIETGAEIVSAAHAREEETKKGMDGSQITGAASSYARKYALAGLFSIDNEKDSDATNKGDSEPNTPLVTPTEEALVRAKVMSQANKADDPKKNIESICKYYKVKTLNDMTYQQCKDYLVKAGVSDE